MNPVKKIGRYEFAIGDVVMVQKRTGIKGLIRPGFNVSLASGLTLYMTASEKAELDEARGLHAKTLEVMGMVATLQKNNRAIPV